MDFDGIMTRLSDLSGSSDHREKPQQNQPMSENDIDRGFPNHYEQLQGSEHIVHGPRWSTDKLLTTYVSATDGLIGKMDGSIPFSKTPLLTVRYMSIIFPPCIQYSSVRFGPTSPPASGAWAAKSRRMRTRARSREPDTSGWPGVGASGDVVVVASVAKRAR